jgi:hypothetical protein
MLPQQIETLTHIDAAVAHIQATLVFAIKKWRQGAGNCAIATSEGSK